MDPMVPENVVAADFGASAQSCRYGYLGLVSRENSRFRYSQEVVAVVIVPGDTDCSRRVMGKNDVHVLMRQSGQRADHAVLSRVVQDIDAVTEYIARVEDKKHNPTDSLRCYLFSYKGPQSLEELDTDRILQIDPDNVSHSVNMFVERRKIQISKDIRRTKGVRRRSLTLDT